MTHDDHSEHYLKRELYALMREDPSVFDFLQDSALDGLWYWDVTGDQADEWMSPSLWRTLGYDPATKKHLASEWMDLIFAEDLQVAYANFLAHCDDPSHPYDQVVRYLHADGSTVWVRCRGMVVRDADGVPQRMLGAHVDVTATKRKEAELESQAAELKRSNAQLEQFAYVASHDLRSPLRTVGGFVSLLANEIGDDMTPRATEFVQRIENGVSRMETLIDGLLSFARLGAKVEMERVSLNDVLAEVLERLEQDIQDTEAVVQVDDLPEVWGSAPQLRMVFQNLVQNAIKYAHADRTPCIEVSAEADGAQVRVKVKDNGIGVSEKFQESIFEMFRRLHPTEAFGGGAGVGLALCARIVEAHDGTITLTSDGMSGSEMLVTLSRFSPQDS